MEECKHFQQVTVYSTDIDVCETCVAVGGTWVHLRLCMTCGFVGCCDSSPNKHASQHVDSTNHPVVRSIEPRETWAYCYPDDLFIADIEA